MASNTEPRRVRYGNLDTAAHLGFVDGDLDAMELRQTAIDAKLDGIKTILMGVLITLTTGSIFLAANLAFK